MDWEVYTLPNGYRAEAFYGSDPNLVARVEGRSRVWLYARILTMQVLLRRGK